MAKRKRAQTTVEASAKEFKGFSEKDKREAAAVIEITTGIGRKYGLKIQPGTVGSKPVLVAVHL